MTQVILHNKYDKASRDFVAAHPDAVVLDWYDEDARIAWQQAGGTAAVSGPSVVWVQPEHDLAPTVTVPQQLMVSRVVEQIEAATSEADHRAVMASVQAEIERVSGLAAITWVERLVADPNTDDSLAKRDLVAAMASYAIPEERIAPLVAQLAATTAAPVSEEPWAIEPAAVPTAGTGTLNAPEPEEEQEREPE